MPTFRLCIHACIAFILSTRVSGQTINRYDIVIDELLPDPSPVMQLPNSEFIELKNISAHPINLRNCTLSDGNTSATITPNFTLLPDSFVIICPNVAVTAFTAFGSTIGVSNFPSLNNDADIISLYSANGSLIHAVAYNNNWYQNAVKSEGGWTLEMIDTKNPCTGQSNWKASTNNNGGSPGKRNSIDAVNTDDLPPALVRSYTIDSNTITAVFDEPLDSTTASLTANYTINTIGHPVSALPVMPACTAVVLKLSTPMSPQATYQLTVKNLTDCAGNPVGQFNTTKAGLPAIADSFAIVINEILFNPPPNGYDYIELYNRSNSVADLKQLYLGNRNATGQLTNITSLSNTSWLLFPGEYKTFTENKQWVQQQYLVKDPSLIIQCAAFPSMPNDKSVIVLMNQQGTIIDELHYDEKWHFPLIDNKEGVALERINYNYTTQDKPNWTSAASTAGFGTPGYINSQLRADIQVQGQVTISPAIFSPDNDGRDDFAIIQYELPEPGYVTNISIFDAHGYRVRNLVQQATLSLTGQFRWDGLNDKLNRLPVGTYVVLTELFHLSGKTKKFKNAVTLVSR
jgi:hypothetical protein